MSAPRRVEQNLQELIYGGSWNSSCLELQPKGEMRS